jgi:hypothetical protein
LGFKDVPRFNDDDFIDEIATLDNNVFSVDGFVDVGHGRGRSLTTLGQGFSRSLSGRSSEVVFILNKKVDLLG